MLLSRWQARARPLYLQITDLNQEQKFIVVQSSRCLPTCVFPSHAGGNASPFVKLPWLLSAVKTLDKNADFLCSKFSRCGSHRASQFSVCGSGRDAAFPNQTTLKFGYVPDNCTEDKGVVERANRQNVRFHVRLQGAACQKCLPHCQRWTAGSGRCDSSPVRVSCIHSQRHRTRL